MNNNIKKLIKINLNMLKSRVEMLKIKRKEQHLNHTYIIKHHPGIKIMQEH